MFWVSNNNSLYKKTLDSLSYLMGSPICTFKPLIICITARDTSYSKCPMHVGRLVVYLSKFAFVFNEIIVSLETQKIGRKKLAFIRDS